jgi:hypothetical protein
MGEQPFEDVLVPRLGGKCETLAPAARSVSRVDDILASVNATPALSARMLASMDAVEEE